MRRRAKSLVLPMFRRVRPTYTKLADTLVNDIRAKSLVPPQEPGGNWMEFSGKNEKKDHEGFVSFLGSDDFETLMTELKVTERITGIETISADAARPHLPAAPERLVERPLAWRN